jgi:hypothetical protein
MKKVVSLTDRPSLFLVHISVRGSVNVIAVARLEELHQRKIPTTPSGIEPVYFRPVAQCLNYLRHGIFKQKKNYSSIV